MILLDVSMNEEDVAPRYYLWKAGPAAEGPLELPALVSKVKSGQAGPETWIYAEAEKAWKQAQKFTELRHFFHRPPASAAGAKPGERSALQELQPGFLRRMKVFAEMSDDQLREFVQQAEVLHFPQFSTVVHKGENGDAMFLVLEGELRSRSMVDGKESTLTTMGPGDSFGEVSILDHGPRSADVVANLDSTVLKISSAMLEAILRSSPGAAAPFLLALGRSAAVRLRHLTRRYEETIHLSRAAGQV